MKRARVVGAGPAGLMAAEVLASAGMAVEILDQHKNPARKFLLAGRGGLNLTHSETLESFVDRYGVHQDFLEPAIRAYPPDALRAWCEGLGIKTFVGSSGRVFPVNLKASPVLRAWLRRLQTLGVTLTSQSPWQGFDDVPTILAMGGASWPELGSDAAWVKGFEKSGIKISPFQPSNVRQPVAWSEHFAARFSGLPIKNAAVSVAGVKVRGELMVAQNGIEGGAVYALSGALRDSGVRQLHIDLRPDVTDAVVAQRMKSLKPKDSFSNKLRKGFNLSPQAIGLMRETGSVNPKDVVLTLADVALDLRRAISVAGGVGKDQVNGRFALHKFPNTYVVGEMLDWDAPTGGYLLQACFSTAHWAAKDLIARFNG